jgi:hypothetical protein
LGICNEIPNDLPIIFSSTLRHGDFINIITLYTIIFVQTVHEFELRHFTVYVTSHSEARVPLLEAVHHTQPSITLFTLVKRDSVFLI